MDNIFVREKGRINRVNLDEVSFIECSGDYTRIICKYSSDVITTSIRLYRWEQMLLDRVNFVRIQRNLIVNINFVKEVIDDTVLVETGNEQFNFNIATTRKKLFRERLFGWMK